MAARQFAETYRPKVLSDFVGQEAAIAQVQGILKKAPPNCLLIAGGTGLGKSSIARVIADSIVGKYKEDIHEVTFGDERGIDKVREIVALSNYAPRGKYAVFIIDEIAKATKDAFSPLLKTLEEPPKQTVFVLVTDEPERLPKTILGRCQKIFLEPLTELQLKKLLLRVCQAEKIKFGTKKIVQYIAQNAGEARTALQMLEAAANAKATAKNYKTVLRGISTSIEVDMLAAKLLIGLYKKEEKIVYTALQKVVEPIAFASSLLVYNNLLIQQYFGGFAWQNAATDLLKKHLKELPKLPRLSHGHNVFVNVRRDLIEISTFEQKHLLVARLGALVFNI